MEKKGGDALSIQLKNPSDFADKDEDIRILTFKRWNLPQTGSITALAQKGVRNGDYVSFQNYHFIDISKLDPSPDGGRFSAAYRKVREIRSAHHGDQPANPDLSVTQEFERQDTYVQQSMMLLGHSNSFWTEKPRQLFITMLQLADISINLKDLEKHIAAVFSRHGIGQEHWALYYCLDFCDLVIFVKEISPATYHNILWDISPIHKQGLDCVRDTITIFGIEYGYLAEWPQKNTASPAPGGKNPGITAFDDEPLSVLINLSVQAVSTWNTLHEALKEFQHKIFRTFGRHDMCILVEGITFPQALKLAVTIDQLCGEKVNEVFGSYEISIADFWAPPDPLAGSSAEIDLDLFQSAKNALDALYHQYSIKLDSIQESNWGYAAEIKRSILALLKNGFAEEFAVSVLLSFMEYLRFVTDNSEQIHCRLAEGDGENLFYVFQRKYFQALNMLTHCTMHSEKQFIQAPAFNATLCDIPPKLLACYAGAAYLIADCLNDEEGRIFSFQIVPDFQPEIYVKQISFVSHRKSKLSIIYLSEKLFYNPSDVIAIMCHEIAHYVGKAPRQREARAMRIFSSIGVYLLFNAAPFTDRDAGLVNALGRAFGEEMFECYSKDRKCRKDRDPYFLDDVREYIEEFGNLLSMVELPHFKSRLQELWVAAMKGMDVESLLEKLDCSLDSTYLSSLHQAENGKEAALNILAGSLVFKLEKMFGEWNCNSEGSEYRAYQDYYSSVFGAFREAYSDLRMVQLLGITDGKKYEAILKRNSEYRLKNRLDFQSYLRHDAVCQAAELQKAEEQLPVWLKGKDQTMRLVTESVKRTLVGYLEDCRKTSYDCKEIRSLLDRLELSDPQEFFGAVRSIIFDYRNKLRKYCDQILNEIKENQLKS